MTKIVNQRTDFDCSIAVYAMWLNKPYEEIEDKALNHGVFPKAGSGMTDAMEDKLGKLFGMDIVRLCCWTGLTGLLAVPSLNFKTTHAIFYKDEKLYDPQTGRDEKLWYPETTERFPCYRNIAIDLNNDYDREMFEMAVGMDMKKLKDFKKKKDMG